MKFYCEDLAEEFEKLDLFYMRNIQIASSIEGYTKIYKVDISDYAKLMTDAVDAKVFNPHFFVPSRQVLIIRIYSCFDSILDFDY